MQSGGEEEQDEEAHTPLPPPMEIIKDPSAQDEKVGRGRPPGLAIPAAFLCWPGAPFTTLLTLPPML